jgi:ribosomal protein S18 acetylase RimI-like enzyme
MLRIDEVTQPSVALQEAYERLLPQLSAHLRAPNKTEQQRLFDRSGVHQLAARQEGLIVGLLTLVVYDIPSGRKGWIEDVVVDVAHRGRGIGQQLVRHAMELAQREGVRQVMLTSNPSRQAAHRLYERMGFERYDTYCFRHTL